MTSNPEGFDNLFDWTTHGLGEMRFKSLLQEKRGGKGNW